MLTLGERGDVRLLHTAFQDFDGKKCRNCNGRWPCIYIRRVDLEDELDAARTLLAQALAALEAYQSDIYDAANAISGKADEMGKDAIAALRAAGVEEERA